MPSTFYPFPGLPTEIQLKVWTFAALPDGTNLQLSAYVPTQVANYVARGNQPEHLWHPSFLRWTAKAQCFKRSNRGVINTAVARKALLGTCRMSRQTVLEAWRELVRGSYVPEEEDYRPNITIKGRDDTIVQLDWMIR